MMELSDNVTYMKLLHELKVIFPNLPDELVRQSIKKHGLDKTACSGALRILESQQISINHNYAPARFYPPEDNRVTTTTPRLSSSTGYNPPDRISGSTGSSSSTTTNKIQGDSYGLKQPSGPNQQLQALISHQMEQRQKLERRMLHTKNELQSMKCGVSNLTVLLEARTKFIQTGLVDVEVANELEEDVSSLQVRCDELQDELSLQVTQLTQGKVPLGEASIDFYESLPAVLNHSGITKDVIPPPITNNTNTSTISTTKSSSTSMPNTPLSSKVSKFLNKISTSCSSSSVLNNTNLQWSCSECTFLNHPALKMCEQCEMPRISSNFTEIQNQEQQQINDQTNNKDCICHGVS